MQLLSYPFRLTPSGAAATVTQGGIDAASEAVAVIILTRKGERVLVPDFGVTDPVFHGLNLTEITAGVIDYGPPDVEVTDATVTYPTDTLEQVELTITTPEE